MGRILCVGHAVEDHIFRVEKMPATPTKHQAKGYAAVGGGPAANAAVAIARLGGDVMLAARVGNDNVGVSIIRDLESEDVDCSLVHCFENAQSSLSAVMVDDDGQRMIINHLDGNMPNSPDWLAKSFPNNIDAVLADIRWPEGARLALSFAKEKNIPAILDADHPIPNDAELLTCATHLAFSTQGICAYTGEADIVAAVTGVAEKFQTWACVTDGEKGVYTADQSGVTHIPAYAVVPVDTTAAGDVWHGAFTLQIARGKSPYEAVQFANAVAAIKVTKIGGRLGTPSLPEVETFMGQTSQEQHA